MMNHKSVIQHTNTRMYIWKEFVWRVFASVLVWQMDTCRWTTWNDLMTQRIEWNRMCPFLRTKLEIKKKIYLWLFLLDNMRRHRVVDLYISPSSIYIISTPKLLNWMTNGRLSAYNFTLRFFRLTFIFTFQIVLLCRCCFIWLMWHDGLSDCKLLNERWIQNKKKSIYIFI